MSTQSSAVRNHQPQVVIIGGGIAGLTSAALLAKAGVSAVLLEKSTSLGGRAATRDRHGYLFNLGPHALDRTGVLHGTLKALGVEVRGRVPVANGGFALCDGRLHTLPVAAEHSRVKETAAAHPIVVDFTGGTHDQGC